MISGSERARGDTVLSRLPGALRETLERSFADRLAGAPDASHNVDNAWYSGGDPRTVGEAVIAVGPQGINILARIHERMMKIDPSGGLFGEIRYLRNLWWGGSAGFKVVYRDPESLRARLQGLFPRVAGDLLLGALEHQGRSALRALLRTPPWRLGSPRESPPDCDTFREIGNLGEESLHFCIGKRAPRPPAFDDIHLDWHSPVRGVDPLTRRCVYALGAGVTHWLQAMRGVGAPLFPFDALEAEIARGSRLGRPAGDVPALARHREEQWALATQGEAGHQVALHRWEEIAAPGGLERSRG